MVSRTDWKNIAVLIIIFLLLYLPFVGKAVHIDDTAYIYVARQIVESPLLPYSFEFDWSSESGLATHISNPPFVSYYLAILIILFSEKVWVLHLGMALFPIIALISMYALSKRFTSRPFVATLILITSCSFMVMSETLMLDIPFLSLFLLSIALFVYGVESKKDILLGLGAVVCGFAYLTKYNGIVIVPILALFLIYRKKYSKLAYLGIPILMMGLWNWYTFAIYGTPHNMQIFNWLLGSQSSFQAQSLIIRAITNLTYIGGATIFPLLIVYPVLTAKRNGVLMGVSSAIALVLSVFLRAYSASFAYPYTIPQLMLFFVFVSVGLFYAFVVLDHYARMMAVKKWDLMRLINENSDDVFLGTWLVAVALFISTLGGGAVRFITMLMPPMILVYMRMIGKNGRGAMPNGVLYGAIALGMVLTMSVSYADYEFANVYREFSQTVDAPMGKGNMVWFTGHGGFQYYMQEKGFRILAIGDDRPIKGDVVITSKIHSPRQLSSDLRERVELEKTKTYPSSFPLVVHNPKSRAGFYTYGSGFLPYSFSEGNLEEFTVYRVVK